MRVLPVMDLLDGRVVHGVAGRRNEYRPVESRLTTSCRPLDVARAFRVCLGFQQLYVADLDAIVHRRPNLETYRQLADDGFDMLVDAGLRSVEEAQPVLDARAKAVVVGLETWPSPEAYDALHREYWPERIVFSLDMKHGRPLCGPAWGGASAKPEDIAARAVAAGAKRMIVLDLAAVGTGSGVPTLDLCNAFRNRWPQVELITGGGIRTADDLRALRFHQLWGVLVATALHNGSIDRAAILECCDASQL